MINSKIILGTVQMGLPYGVNNATGKISGHESREILMKAHASGIQFLDTAEAYGDAHQVIGNFHRENPGHTFQVITKIPAAASVSNAAQKVEQYLNDLQVDRLEALMFHSFDSYQKNRSMVSSWTHLREQNLFRHLGVSVYTNQELEVLVREEAVDLIQLPFNLLDNISLRGDLLEEAKINGKIIHTRSAFLQGLFFKAPDDNHTIVLRLKDQLLEIHRIAAEENISMAALALGYCLRQKNIDHVLIGVDSVQQLETNLAAASVRIKAETIERIDHIVTDNIALLNPSLWN